MHNYHKIKYCSGRPDLTKSRTDADSDIAPSLGMGTVYVSVASSPITSVPSTKLRMSALRSGIVPSFRNSRKSATYRAISSVSGSSTLRCSSWVSASSLAASSCFSRCLRDMIRGDETLRAIARELVYTVRYNVTIDWTLRENVRAKLRAKVKRILRKHGYPPDKPEKATVTVLEQAEVLSEGWTTVWDCCARSAFTYTANLNRIVNSQVKVHKQRRC